MQLLASTNAFTVQANDLNSQKAINAYFENPTSVQPQVSLSPEKNCRPVCSLNYYTYRPRMTGKHSTMRLHTLMGTNPCPVSASPSCRWEISFEFADAIPLLAFNIENTDPVLNTGHPAPPSRPPSRMNTSDTPSAPKYEGMDLSGPDASGTLAVMQH